MTTAELLAKAKKLKERNIAIQARKQQLEAQEVSLCNTLVSKFGDDWEEQFNAAVKVVENWTPDA